MVQNLASSKLVVLDVYDAINRSILISTVLRRMGKEFNIFYIAGPPGIGKTQIAEQITKKLGYGFKAYSPGLEVIEKMEGVPQFVKETVNWTTVKSETKKTSGEILTTEWSYPEMIKEINDMAAQYEFVVVLFDDWHICNKEMQSIGFEVFTHYSLHNNPIAQNVIFILSGNETSAAGAQVQLTAIRNRTTVYYVRPNVEQWITGYAIPMGVHPAIVTFFKDPTNEQFFQEEEDTERQFGSARAWTSLGNIISIEEELKDLHHNGDIDHHCIHAAIQGSVSELATPEFIKHYEVWSRFNINEIFNGNWTIPDDAMERIIFSTCVLHEFYKRCIQGNEDSASPVFMSILDGLNARSPEIAATTIINLGDIPENKVKGWVGGQTLLTNLLRNGKLTNKQLLSDMYAMTRTLGR